MVFYTQNQIKEKINRLRIQSNQLTNKLLINRKTLQARQDYLDQSNLPRREVAEISREINNFLVNERKLQHALKITYKEIWNFEKLINK